MSDVPVEMSMVWDMVPEANCKGLCQEYCGPIMASPLETAILAARGIYLRTPEQWIADRNNDPEPCPALSAEGRCTVYEVRPMVCRLFGTTEPPSLVACPHGCGPVGGRLVEPAGQRLNRLAIEVGTRVPYPGRRK